MALKTNKKGEYTISSEAQAAEALKQFQTIQAEVEAFLKKHAIPDKLKDAEQLRAAATRWATDKDAERIGFQIGKELFHATLIKAFHGQMYVGTEDDIPADAPAGTIENIVPLQEIIEEKFGDSIQKKGSRARKVWLQVTRRVVDRAAVDQVVSEGTLSVDDVTPAFFEKPKTPYLRIFKDS